MAFPFRGRLRASSLLIEDGFYEEGVVFGGGVESGGGAGFVGFPFVGWSTIFVVAGGGYGVEDWAPNIAGAGHF